MLLLLDDQPAVLDPKIADQVLRVTEAVVKSCQLTTLVVSHFIHRGGDVAHRDPRAANSPQATAPPA